MRIDLKNLISGSEECVPFEGEADLSREKLHGEYPFLHPVRYSGEIRNHLGVLKLMGDVETIYETACARCLKPLHVPLSASVDAVLSRDEEAEEEDDLFVLTEDAIDPADVMIPTLILQVDMAYLCKEDCKGLCPICGADRNVTDCGCEQHGVDPRLAVLQSLLDKGQEGKS